MIFPVSGIEASPFAVMAPAFLISLFCSTTGISGAFMLLPWQISVLGYVNPGVSATNQIFNILACPGGVYRYAREGRLLWPLALIIALGTLPGVFAGAIIRLFWLSKPDHFILFAALVLFYLGLRMLFTRRGKTKNSAGQQFCKVTSFTMRGFSFTFQGNDHSVQNAPLLALSAVVGLVGGIYGVGGGAIMVPFLVSFFGLPIHAIGGATLFATFLTSIAGVSFYSFISLFWDIPQGRPDWLLGCLLGLGGLAGMYCGAALQKYLPAKILRYFLIIIIMGTAIRYFIQFLGAL